MVKKIEQVQKFCYWGSWLTDDGKCDTDFRVRIAMAKTAFSRRKELLSRDMNQCEQKDCESGSLECAFVWLRDMDNESGFRE